jgi:hypothetical protein
MRRPAQGTFRPLRTIGRGPDLAAQVTVFVTTVGAQTFAECLRHLDEQDVTVGFELIDRVAPLPAALQQMIDRCVTPYFVQVDEDMLLDTDAVRRLYELIDAEWPNVAVLVGRLLDPHLGRWIEGIKIHRHDYVSRFPWHDHESVMARNAAIVAAGYRVTRRPTEESGMKMTFGEHVIGDDPLTVFQRYRDLEQLRLRDPDAIAWFGEYPAQFLRRFGEQPNAVDFFALMGVLAANGGSADSLAQVPIKDFRRPNDRAFELAARLWQTARPSEV